MNKLPAKELRILIGLSFVAGLVDVLGFSSLGGHFLSFMSGNSTFLALAIGRGDIMLGAGLMALIGLFFIGVMMGMSVGGVPPPRIIIEALSPFNCCFNLVWFRIFDPIWLC